MESNCEYPDILELKPSEIAKDIFQELLKIGDPDSTNERMNEETFFYHGLKITRCGSDVKVYDTYGKEAVFYDKNGNGLYRKIANRWLLLLILNNITL